jgi:hypothetical protein
MYVWFLQISYYMSCNLNVLDLVIMKVKSQVISVLN